MTQAATAPPGTPLELPDGTVTVLRRGGGEPLLFLHGSHFAGRWLPFHERLESAFDVVYPIHPGFEEGQPPRWLQGIDDLVLCYRDLLDELGLDRVSIVGHALGAWVAADVAVLWPERVAGLVLVAPLGLRVPDHPPADFLSMPVDALAELLFGGDPGPHAELLPDGDDPEEFARYYGEAGVSARLIWERRYDLKLERRLPRVRVPALVVAGEDDRVIPAAHAARWVELLPESRLETIGGAGHAVLVQEPERAAELVGAFLQEART